MSGRKSKWKNRTENQGDAREKGGRIMQNSERYVTQCVGRSPTCMDWECSRGHWGWSENVVIGIQLS